MKGKRVVLPPLTAEEIRQILVREGSATILDVRPSSLSNLDCTDCGHFPCWRIKPVGDKPLTICKYYSGKET